MIAQPLDYLQSALKEFQYYKLLADETIARLSPEQMHSRPNSQSNSVATIIKHVSGNMRSRFTNFLTEDGEKTWRNRDAEFEAPLILQKELGSEQLTNSYLVNYNKELSNAWNEAWKILFDTLASLSSDDLPKTVFIRTEPHSVIQAINRQIAHYAYHVGQIVFIGKCLVDNWQSLSIPLNASQHFNTSKGLQ